MIAAPSWFGKKWSKGSFLMRKPREFFGTIKKILIYLYKFDLLKPKIKIFDFQNLKYAQFLLSEFNFWCRYFSKHFLKPTF